MTIDSSAITSLLDKAAAQGRYSLFEHEVYAVLKAAGCNVPDFVEVEESGSVDNVLLQNLLRCVVPHSASEINGVDHGELILKVVSPEIAHKTDVGGVSKVQATVSEIEARIKAMVGTIPSRYVDWLAAHPSLTPESLRGATPETIRSTIRKSIRSFLLVEKIEMTQTGAGAEMLVGLRHNREFGPVITLGIGGVDTEFLGAACQKGKAIVSCSPDRLSALQMLDAMKSTLVYRRLAGLTRDRRRLVDDSEILKVIEAFRDIAMTFGTDETEGWTITELEVNPFAVSSGKLVALDGLLKFRAPKDLPSARPSASINALLHPSSMGIVGVSSKGMNMGRIILRNVLEAGFNPERVYIVRPGLEELDGIKCFSSVEALPERVDAFVLAVGADQVPEVLEDIMRHDKAVGVILIAGGLGEKEGGQAIELRLKSMLKQGRAAGKPLVINGGNSLGVVSRPGKYHTLFIPKNKLPLSTTGRDNVAFISQSGAYMISRMSKMDWLSPRYAMSTGNQTDLSVTDYLSFLATNDSLQTLAVYVEGFQDGDGLLFARAVEKAVSCGKDVIFFKAGRTAEGKTATSGHTASLAGEYDVCASIVQDAGAHVAPTFEDFLNLVKVSSLLGKKQWKGPRLAAMSNAGYETVGIADSLRGDGWNLELAKPSDETKARLAKALADSKLDSLVDVRNPLDVTPMANDQVHEDVMRAFIDDPGVDLVLCATIPLTPAMATLPVGDGVSRESSIESDGSVPNRLGRVVLDTNKPLVASIDCGVLFDPMARLLEERGVPTFRSADAAIRAVGLYLSGRLRRG